MKKKCRKFFISLIVVLIALPATFFPQASKAVNGTTRYETVIYEAENADLDSLQVMNSYEGYSGTGYVGPFGDDDSALTFNVSVPHQGEYDLLIGYATPNGEKGTHLHVNEERVYGSDGQEEILLLETVGFAEVLVNNLVLKEGDNTIVLEKGWGWYYIDYIKIALPGSETPISPVLQDEEPIDGTPSGTPEGPLTPGTLDPVTGSVIYEAENAILLDLTIGNELDGFSGTGYVEGFTNTTGEVTFKLEAERLGLYHLAIGFSTPDGGKETRFLLNGKAQGNISLPQVDGFSEVSAGTVLLNEGINWITLADSWGWYKIDYIKLTPAATPEPHQVTADLINPNATAEARSLMAFMVDHFGTHILSGQQEDVRRYLKDTDYIYQLTGKRPAIIGFDLMDQSPSRVERGSSSDVIEHAIRWDSEMGGIVKFTWHWNAPKDLIDEEGKEWWRGFYTDATTFDVEYAVNNPDSEDYQLLIRDIDVISAELLKLQEQGIPVIWRPLHEAEGGWFWWGAKGPEPVIELWKIMYHRMTDYHGLNNLIWMWNSVDPAWYPGDDYVDMVSYDSYPGDFNYAPIAHRYEELVALSNNRKLISMAENGSIPDPDLLQAYHAYWNMFVTWNDFPQSANSEEHLIHVYNHEFVLTLDDLPDFKTYIGEELAKLPVEENGTDPDNNDESIGKGKLPNTATNNYTIMIIGLIILLLGAVSHSKKVIK